MTKKVNKTIEVIQVNTISKNGKRLGRPANANSRRQQTLALKAEMREKGLIKRGRPVDPTSKKQMREQARLEFLANGGVIKRGRPKMVKTEVEAEAKG
jgi:hypothetical protein